jgi:hypothetical protein
VSICSQSSSSELSSPDPTQSRTLTRTDTTKVQRKPYPQFSVASPMFSILLSSGLLVQLTVRFTECTQYLSPIAGRKLTKPHPRHPYRHHGLCTLKTPFLAYFLLETKQQSDHRSDRWLLILTPHLRHGVSKVVASQPGAQSRVCMSLQFLEVVASLADFSSPIHKLSVYQNSDALETKQLC